MFGKVRTERVTPHGPLGETRVPFESDQYKHKLFTFQNLKAKVPQKWTQMSSVKHISWSFLFPVGLCVRVSHSLLVSSLLWCVCPLCFLPFQSFLNSGSLCLCAPVSCCPFLPVGLH